MKLRKLQINDALLMLEWMHDKSVVENMQTDFASKTIDDCRTFIENSYDENKSVHLAITDDSDIYMGTASLKNINNNNSNCCCGRGRCWNWLDFWTWKR